MSSITIKSLSFYEKIIGPLHGVQGGILGFMALGYVLVTPFILLSFFLDKLKPTDKKLFLKLQSKLKNYYISKSYKNE